MWLGEVLSCSSHVCYPTSRLFRLTDFETLDNTDNCKEYGKCLMLITSQGHPACLSTISHPDIEDSEETRTFFQEGFVSLCPLKLGDRFILACWHCWGAEGSQRFFLLPGRRVGQWPHVLVSQRWQNYSMQEWVLVAVCPQILTVSGSFKPNLWGLSAIIYVGTTD